MGSAAGSVDKNTYSWWECGGGTFGDAGVVAVSQLGCVAVTASVSHKYLEKTLCNKGITMKDLKGTNR